MTAILSLARETGMSVIAEGVETEELHAELVGLGCELAQGFLYDHPKPPEELALDGYSSRVRPGVGDPLGDPRVHAPDRHPGEDQAMTVSVAILNLVLGLVYVQYGSMTLIDMRRHWGSMGFSHFGAAWIAMAFTCGPHHFAHGLHLLTANGRAGPLDFVAVLIGFPAGVTWFLLRVEAFRRGAGDRFVKGNPLWVLALPTLAGIYLTALVSILVDTGSLNGDHIAAVTPNLLLILIYSTIGYYLVRTQVANRRPLRGWSVSGLALAVVFPTCAVMHAVYAYYATSGRYGPAAHTTVDRLGRRSRGRLLPVGRPGAVPRHVPRLESGARGDRDRKRQRRERHGPERVRLRIGDV